MFRKFRIAVLLLILLFVSLNTYFDRVYSTDWDIPLRVAVFPINGDGTAVAERHVQALRVEDFGALESFFAQEAQHYGVKLEQPLRFSLAPPIRQLPPILEPRSGRLSIALWSLRMRYWAWRVPAAAPGASADLKLFLLYHDPQHSPSLPHSVGLQKGLFAIANVFADRRAAGSNDTVIAHELLHTLGATDKYDPVNNQPLYPQGFAEPRREPRYPQSFAELMAGRIPTTTQSAQIPGSLDQVLIGPATAAEINWKKQ